MTPAVTTVADVLERLSAIDHALQNDDGVKWFNKLYLEVTQQVAPAVSGQHQTEAAPGFLEELYILFARRYFDAFDAAENGATLSPEHPFHAWRALFEPRFASDIAPVQFALAGMNAHINHDLAIALCDTFAARGNGPRGDGPEHTDYQSVNGLIAKVEKDMKAWMMNGLLKELDLAFGSVDDTVAVWNVQRARDAAWIRAEVIWSLQALPSLRDNYVAMNDRAVGFAGRALLTPVGLIG